MLLTFPLVSVCTQDVSQCKRREADHFAEEVHAPSKAMELAVVENVGLYVLQARP